MISLISIIKAIGYIGVFGIIFAETGVFFGFILPGDTLLFACGVLAYKKYFNLPLIIIIIALAAICGGFFGYWFGKKVSEKIFTKKDTLFFKKKHLEKAHDFFNEYGSKTIFIGRYVPIVRTFVSTIAGVANMKYKKFAVYNIVGAIAWATTIPLLGYFVGKRIPSIDDYILPIIFIACILSFSPIVYEVIRKKKRQKTNPIV